MLQLDIVNEIHSCCQVMGKDADVLFVDFSIFEDWLDTRANIITGFIIGKYLTMEFEFVDNISNEELFERLLVLYGKGE